MADERTIAEIAIERLTARKAMVEAQLPELAKVAEEHKAARQEFNNYEKYLVLANGAAILALLGIIGKDINATMSISDGIWPLYYFSAGLVLGGAAKFYQGVTLRDDLDDKYYEIGAKILEVSGVQTPPNFKKKARWKKYANLTLQGIFVSTSATAFLGGLIETLTLLGASS